MHGENRLTGKVMQFRGLDKTLTKEGYAADAKATGEGLNKNAEEIKKTDEAVKMLRYQVESLVPEESDFVGAMLTASDGTVFKFGVTAGGEYGYVIKDKDGADTVIPFKSDGADALYEALKFSELVTEGMSFDEMCNVLATHYPETLKLYMSKANEGGFTAYNVTGFENSKVGFREYLNVEVSAYATRSAACAVSAVIDMTKYNKFNFEYTCSATRGDTNNACKVFFTRAKTSSMTEVKGSTVMTNGISANGKKTIDVSELQGEYYVVVMSQVYATVGETNNVGIKVSNMYLTV